jgi:mannose/fructose/N-acetylgalactosamine-specific phosphotransferase system component IIC
LIFIERQAAYRVEFGVAILIVTAILFAVIAYGMRHFYEWARRPSMVAAIVGMCMIPFGTLAGIYCLILLRKASSMQIFTTRYRELVARENYRSMGWLAWTSGCLLAVCLWCLFFLFKDIGVDWEKVDRLFKSSTT